MIYADFHELLKDNAEKHSDAIALRQKEETVTCRQLYDRVLVRAQEYRDMPVQCVGLAGASSIQWVVDMFASAIAGKRTVLLDPMENDERINSLIAAAGVDYIPDAGNRHFTPVSGRTGDIEYGGCLLFFTSGTTASGKAVVLSQRALCRSAYNGQSRLPASPSDTIVSLLPLNHVFGFVCTLLWPLANGATAALGRGIRTMKDDPGYYHATILPVVPTLLHFLLLHDGLNPELRTVLVGASPIDRGSLALVNAKHIRVSFGYGLTETASGLAISVNASDPYGMELCPDTEIRIGDDNTVYVRTPCMMEGYYHDSYATDLVLKNGELDTGDLGEIDRNGCLRIYGRRNDVLVMPNGKKIFLPEWEEKLSARLHTEAAMSMEDGKIAATIVTDKLENEIWPVINEFNRENPIGQKIAALHLRKEKLPRTITGKIQRWQLQKEEKGENNND